MRISKAATEKFNLSRRAVKEYIKAKKVYLNGTRVSSDVDISNSDEIYIQIDTPEISFEINEYLICAKEGIRFIDKPSFMHTERLRPEEPLTVEDIFPEIELLSRLDYLADGILAGVEKGVEVNYTEKTYLAAVYGELKGEVRMDNLIDASKRKKVLVTEFSGRNYTIIKPLEQKEGKTLVEVTLNSAQRHQVRAYLSYIGFPIMGDPLYGGKPFERLMLHCKKYTVNKTSEYSNLTDNFLEYFKRSAKI